MLQRLSHWRSLVRLALCALAATVTLSARADDPPGPQSLIGYGMPAQPPAMTAPPPPLTSYPVPSPYSCPVSPSAPQTIHVQVPPQRVVVEPKTSTPVSHSCQPTHCGPTAGSSCCQQPDVLTKQLRTLTELATDQKQTLQNMHYLMENMRQRIDILTAEVQTLRSQLSVPVPPPHPYYPQYPGYPQYPQYPQYAPPTPTIYYTPTPPMPMTPPMVMTMPPQGAAPAVTWYPPPVMPTAPISQYACPPPMPAQPAQPEALPMPSAQNNFGDMRPAPCTPVVPAAATGTPWETSDALPPVAPKPKPTTTGTCPIGVCPLSQSSTSSEEQRAVFSFYVGLFR